MEKMKALNDIMLRIGGDATKGVGVKIGDIVNSYSNLKGRSDEIAERFLDIVLKDPNKLEETLTWIKDLDYGTKPREVTLKKEGSRLYLGRGDELKPGAYKVVVYWEYGSGADKKSGKMVFWSVKETETNVIVIPEEQVEEVLKQIGKSEAEISVSRVEVYDYRLRFPTKFSVGGASLELDFISNELKIGMETYKMSISNLDVSKGRLLVDVELEGKSIRGNNLKLFFYSNGEVEIEIGGDSCSIKKIEIDKDMNLMKITYEDNGREVPTEYSFNLRSLDEQTGIHFYEKSVEGQERVSLREELFEILGYDAKTEL
ncbi:MAG: hypothetical protein FGF50_09780, partial [Candidatus Brockarchaeota archaeon]|nr:hypothetical protein [Candidatus Brockarchaeota archaeon]